MSLSSAISSIQVPQHLAVIMDGNGRWAKRRGLPRFAGHEAGLKAVTQLVKLCSERKIKFLTLFAFSSENWHRPPQEIKGLLSLFLQALREEHNTLMEHNIKVRFIGDLMRFSPLLRKKMQHMEVVSRENTGLILVIAAGYGGHWDILQAVRMVSEQAVTGKIRTEDITIERFSKYLQLSDLPPPDLCIRTGGEQRLSNFLLWHLAYSELYFTPCLWPDFDENLLEEALTCYASRERRFGLVNEETH